MDKMILGRAQSAMLARDYGLAARLYKTLLKTSPDSIEIHNALGSLYVKSGEDAKAIPYYENILTYSPHDIDAMNSLGGIYRRLKNYEKAIDVLEKALDENTKTAMINYTLGFTYKDMGNYDDAIDCFESVVSENPSDVLAYNHLGAIYAIKKNFPRAVQAYRRGLQTDPNHPILHFNLGHAYESEKNYPEAIKCYEQALKAKPGWIEAICDEVNLLLKCTKTIRAYDITQKAVQLYPTDGNLHALLGKVCVKRYDYEGAQNAYEKAERFHPDDPGLILDKANSFEKGFQFEEAAVWANRAYSLGLKTEKQRKFFTHIMLSAGEYAKAQNELKSLLIEFPSDTSVLDAQAQCLILGGKEQEALGIFKKIAELNPKYHHHWLEAARRFVQLGDNEKARAYAEKYIEQRPLNPAAFNLLGRINELDGDIDKALESYKKACEMNVENIFGKKEYKRLLEIKNRNLQEGIPDYISKLNEEQRLAQMPFNPMDIDFPELAEKQEEDFDFDQMGLPVPIDEDEEEIELKESVPLLAELSVDEELSAFDDIMHDTEEIMEDEVEEEEEMDVNPDEKIEAVLNDDGISSLDDIEEFNNDAEAPSKRKAPRKEPEPEPEPFEWEPEPARKRREPPQETTDEDISNFLNDSAPLTRNDALDMLREDTEPRMDPRLVDKIDDAVETLNEAVSEVQEKAEQALSRAEEAVQAVQEALPENYEPSVFSDPGSEVYQNASRGDENPAVPNFEEPEFDAPFEMKDPFDNIIPNYAEEPVSEPQESSALPSESPVTRAFENAKEFLPNIVKIIEDNKVSEKYRTELGLFSKLRSLSDSLPAEQRTEFLSSKTRMLMDYIIGKMSGKPGLVKTVENLLKSGILENEVDYDSLKKEAESLTGNELARKVISDLKKLTADLPDQDLAKALNDSADEVLNKL